MPQVITTVVTAPSTSDLVDLAIVKDEFKITDGTDDAALQRYISAVSVMAASYCNRIFGKVTLKDEFWPSRDRHPALVPGGTSVLQLTNWPVISVASVLENGIALIDGTDYRVDYDNAQLIRLDSSLYPNVWPVWPIVVQYDSGYAVTPPDLVQALFKMVRTNWFSRSRDPALRQESVFGVYEAQYWIATGTQSGSMTPDVADILNGYRIPVVT